MKNEHEKSIAAISISKATLLLAVFTLLSRLAGFLRDLILASQFGAGDVLDAYYTAFRIPDLLFNFLILGTLTVAFLPIFNRQLVKNSESASKLASTVFTLSVCGMAVLAVLLFILAPVLTKLIAPGFEGELYELTLNLTKIMMISPVIFTASNIASVVLQSYHRFLPTAAAPLLYNAGIVFGAVFLTNHFGPAGLAIGVIIGALMHMTLQLGALRKLPIKIKISFDYKLKEIKEIGKLYLPRLMAMDSMQISLLIGSIIGSLLASGSIAIFNFANNLNAAPLGIFALTFAVASFPQLSRTWAAQKIEEFKELITDTSIQILFFILPASALVIILRAQIVRLLLGHGRFDWEETILTAQTLGVLAISMFAQSLIPLYSRAFYATYNTFVPVVISIIIAVINIAGALFFTNYFGVVGLGIATSLAAVIGFLFLAIALRVRIGKLPTWHIIENILKIMTATIFSATSIYATLYAISPVVNTTTTVGILIQTILASLIGATVYLLVGLLLQLRQARAFTSEINLWLRRLNKPLTVIFGTFNKTS